MTDANRDQMASEPDSLLTNAVATGLVAPARSHPPAHYRQDHLPRPVGSHCFAPRELDMFDPSRINEAAFLYYRHLDRVRQLVEEDPGRPVSLGSAAQIACLEKKYFSALFRAKTGVRFKEW